MSSGQWRKPKTVAGPEFRDLGRCVLWTGTKAAKSYGVAYQGAKRVKAHRAAWEATHGPIPAGMLVCHHCDTPACVNVAHLFLGSNVDNMADQKAKGRQAIGTRNPNARLSEDDVKHVRRRLANGEQGRAIAKSYGVSENVISLIKRGITWVHVEAGEM